MGHREQLLDAARRLLQQRGYARITARDLVAESGTNLASIGYHFGSKDALLNAATAAFFDEYTEKLADFVMADTGATPLERAAATWVAALGQLPEQHPIIRAFIEQLPQAIGVPELRDQLAAHYAKARVRVAELVAAALADGTAPDDPRCTAVAGLVIAACDGLAVQYLLDPVGAPNPGELAAGLQAVLAASFPTG